MFCVMLQGFHAFFLTSDQALHVDILGFQINVEFPCDFVLKTDSHSWFLHDLQNTTTDNSETQWTFTILR